MMPLQRIKNTTWGKEKTSLTPDGSDIDTSRPRIQIIQKDRTANTSH